MATISQEDLDRLRAAGLVVSDPFVPDHIAFPDGVVVAKPASVAGNSLPEHFRRSWAPTGATLDAPTLFFYCDAGRWFVESHDWKPGPGPGDFVDEWGTPEEAVDDILDFYFGDAARMESKRNREDPAC